MVNDENPSVVLLGRYYDVLLDDWFKRAFQDGKDSKRLLTLFLRDLIPERDIRDIAYAPQEMTSPYDKGKSIRVDVICTDARGDRFVVEMQREKQTSFYERAIFNSSFSIQRQLQAGDDYALKPMYFIGLLQFSLHPKERRFLYQYNLTERENGELMTDKVNYIFLELPKCKSDDNSSELEKFGFAMYHLSEFEDVPKGFEGEIFDVLFNSTEITNLAPEDRIKLLNDMNSERDTRNQIAYARKEGLAEGEAKGREEVARNMISMGLPNDVILKATGLSPEDISRLKG